MNTTFNYLALLLPLLENNHKFTLFSIETANKMDEDTVFGIFVCGFFLFFVTSPLWITACIAAAATRHWSKEKIRRAKGGIASSEANPLVEEPDSDQEEDFLDSEDEEYYTAKRDQKAKEREEKERDWTLSPRAKFFKEWKKCWKTGSKDQLIKERELREQDERRKIAREAVREYLRIERRRARKAVSKSETSELPTYSNATKA